MRQLSVFVRAPVFCWMRRRKGVSVLEAVKRQQLWFRWLIYLAAIFVVLLTGIYGPGFAASSFIYFQF